MIRINLALKKQSNLTADGKGGRGASLAMGDLQDQLRNIPFRKILVPVLVGYAASFLLDSYKEDNLAKLDKIIAKQRADGAKISTSLEKVKVYEALKKSLEADELIIKTKLETVKKLISDRGAITKTLLYMASTIPKDAWITAIKSDAAVIMVKGSSIGFNPISDFMKNLYDGHFFSSIELVSSENSKDGSEFANFELKIKRK